MYVSMSALSKMFLYSVLLGMFLGAFYDTIRLFRIMIGVQYGNSSKKSYDLTKLFLVGKYLKREKEKEKKRGFISVFVAFGDVFFFLTSSIAILIFTYYFNNGEFRFFIVLGAVFGFFIYYLSLGRIVVFLSEKIIFASKVVFLYTLFFVFYPIYYVFSKIYALFGKIIVKIILIIQKAYDIIYMYRYSQKRKRIAIRDSKRGFLYKDII